ncbi:hypothetical protein EHI8A_229190 [Entamoeba histolytica HM-1:IMSS-B]|uniref:Uncharacterized protein n=1 Tax=Entamoeba histolytica HM-1:IMSS-B TaxID=885319 RepID=M3TMP9_ENTH1|nr:hypothetical protein EHI8A_229190 [Entamoeba histolytica HM-1:IMSS-B]
MIIENTITIGNQTPDITFKCIETNETIYNNISNMKYKTKDIKTQESNKLCSSKNRLRNTHNSVVPVIQSITDVVISDVPFRHGIITFIETDKYVVLNVFQNH